MNTSVISADYRENQQRIIDLQQSWEKKLENAVFYTLSRNVVQEGIPLMMQGDLKVDGNLYQEMLFELTELIRQANPELSPQIQTIQSHFRVEYAAKWVDEALSLNSYYFSQLAEEWGVDDWILAYLAEQLVRPYLRMVAGKYQKEFTDFSKKGICPCCGEPVRIAKLEEKGSKAMICPRCYATWQEKRMACSHCGSEKEQDLRYLSVEGEEKAQIHICNTCHGYLKVIDTRNMLDKPAPDLLDLNTIHLDLIAQERGYGLGTKESQTS